MYNGYNDCYQSTYTTQFRYFSTFLKNRISKRPAGTNHRGSWLASIYRRSVAANASVAFLCAQIFVRIEKLQSSPADGVQQSEVDVAIPFVEVLRTVALVRDVGDETNR
jgi:hypothetical protein